MQPNAVVSALFVLCVSLPASANRATIRDIHRFVKAAESTGLGGVVTRMLDRRLGQAKLGFVLDSHSKGGRHTSYKKMAKSFESRLRQLGIKAEGFGGAESPTIQTSGTVTTLTFTAVRLHTPRMKGRSFSELTIALDAANGTISIKELGRENPGDSYVRKPGRPGTIEEAYRSKTARPPLAEDPARWSREFTASSDGAAQLHLRIPGRKDKIFTLSN